MSQKLKGRRLIYRKDGRAMHPIMWVP